MRLGQRGKSYINQVSPSRLVARPVQRESAGRRAHDAAARRNADVAQTRCRH